MPSFLGSVDQRTRDTIKYARKTYKEAAPGRSTAPLPPQAT